MAAKVSPHAEEGRATLDPIWDAVRREGEAIIRREPEIAALIYVNILNHARLEDAVAHRIAERLDHPDMKGDLIRQTYAEAIADEPNLGEAMRADIAAVYDRDPACNRFIEPVLYFKGFHALEVHRLANWLWRHGRQDFAYYLQSRASGVFQVDIHPAVPIGRGVFIDHGTGLVVGGTAVIEDDVSILQDVTLGGTGKEKGDRHPKVRCGVLIGAGAKILGNIEIGQGSRVAAGSVVLHPVPPHTTVAGVPARIVGQTGATDPSRSMDQMLKSNEEAEAD
jgi:serine O-acetyltransferase